MSLFKLTKLFLALQPLMLLLASFTAMAQLPVVTITQYPTNPQPGDEVTLTATINNPGRITLLKYDWNLNDPFGAGDNEFNGYFDASTGTVMFRTISMKAHSFQCGSYTASLDIETSPGALIDIMPSDHFTTFYDVEIGATFTAGIIIPTTTTCLVPGTNPSVYTNVYGASLPAQPTYIWSVVNPNLYQLNSDYLIVAPGGSGVSINFDNAAYLPSSYPFYITLQCIVNSTGSGCRAVTQQIVTIKQAPLVPVPCSTCLPGASTFNICANSGTLQLGGTPVAGVTYTWTTTGTTPTTALNYLSSPSGLNPTFTVPAATGSPFSYKVTASTNANSCVSSAVVTYNINTLNLTLPSAASICTSGAVSGISVGGGQPPYKYSWTSTDGINEGIQDATLLSPILSGLTRAVKTYQLTVTDNNGTGCHVSKNIAIDFKKSTLANLTTPTVNWCSGSHTLYGSQLFTGGTSPFIFNTSGAVSSTTLAGSTVNVTTPASGSVMVTDGDGCKATNSYVVNATPLSITGLAVTTQSPYISGTPNSVNWISGMYTIACNSGRTSLAVNFSIVGGCAPYTFYWTNTNFSGLPPGSSTPPSVPYAYSDGSAGPFILNTTGSYSKQLNFTPIIDFLGFVLVIVVKDAYGTTTSMPVTYVQAQSPVQPVLSNLCSGYDITTTATNYIPSTPNATPVTNTWTYPSGATVVQNAVNTLHLTYAANQSATVVFNSTSACGTVSVPTTYPVAFQSKLDLGPDKGICSGQSFYLSPVGGATGSSTTNSWSPITGLSSPTTKNTVVSPTTSTTYTLTSTGSGCTYTDQIYINVNPVDPSSPYTWKTGLLSTNMPWAYDNIVCDKATGNAYYRAGNIIYKIALNTTTNEWEWSSLPATNVANDLTITPNGRLVYRTTDNKLSSMVNVAGVWSIDPLNNAGGNVQGPITATNGQIFYRNMSNGLESVYLYNNVWYWSGMDNAATSNVGNVMAFNFAEGSNLYYRTQDNNMNSIYYANGKWNWTNLNNIANTAASGMSSSIAISPNGQIFYKTNRGTIESLYKNGGTWSWSGLNTPSNVSGDLSSDNNGNIYYRTNNQEIYQIYWTSANGWQTDYLSYATMQGRAAGNWGIVLSSNTPYSNFAVANDGLFFRDAMTGIVRKLYSEGPCDYPVNLRTAESPVPGLNLGVDYSIYSGTWTTLPDFTTLTSTGSGHLNNISAPSATYNRGYVLHGYIYVPTDGSYGFYMRSDDGSQLLIGNKVVIDNNNTHDDSQEKSGVIWLRAGRHAYSVRYFQVNAGASLQLSYEGPTIFKTVVPNSVLSVDAGTFAHRDATVDMPGTNDAAEDKTEISIYPNPFNNHLNVLIQGNSLEEKSPEIKVYNLLGTEVYSTSVTMNEEQELLIDGSTGIYIAVVKLSDGSVHQFKLMKE